jgi:antitoxin (DNA-binding transcriptional repressor) of toxin-antitoxin stability system
VDEAAAGEDIVIAKNGTPIVRLVPVAAAGRRTGFGTLEGTVRVAANFDAPLPDDVMRRFGIEP